jgi:hypothetical protein
MVQLTVVTCFYSYNIYTRTLWICINKGMEMQINSIQLSSYPFMSNLTDQRPITKRAQGKKTQNTKTRQFISLECFYNNNN